MSYTAAKRRVDTCKMGAGGGGERSEGERPLKMMQHTDVQGCTVLFPWHNTHRSSPSVRGKLGQFQTRLRIPHWSWSLIGPLGLCFQLLKRRHIYFRFSKELLTALHWNSYQISCAMQMYQLMYGKFSLNILHIVIFRAYIPKNPNVWKSKCLWEKIVP